MTAPLNTEGLIERLRAWRDWHGTLPAIVAMNEAADRIAALEAPLELGSDADELARTIDGFYEDASQNPCTCNIDENSCRYCSACRQAQTKTRKLLAALEAEREADKARVVELKAPFPDRSPFGEIGREGAPDGYLIDPGAGSGCDHVRRDWPSERQLDDIARRGGSITPLYAARQALKGAEHGQD